ncbi:MAG: DNA alkylation repair protein, partial [Alistipes sp.]|nr:DNA alkylation repair protein [Alistipes sp.]
MGFTSRMVALLSALRRERNGAVADEMRLFGTACGLNYGVSLPTVRSIARAETPDHDFARFLLLQDVRELRLAAFHIARPECLVSAEFPVWAAAIINSELAEEAAFALLSRAAVFPALFETWIAGEDPLPAYAALMAAARWTEAPAEWADAAVASLRRQV